MGNHHANPFARGNRTTPSMTLRDLYNREVDEGDEVIGHQMELKAPRMIVRSIRPNLAPGAPAGTMTVICTAQIAIVVKANTPVQDLILVRTLAEQNPQAAAELDDEKTKLIES